MNLDAESTIYFNPREDEYVSKVARTIEEARMRVEAGFEYVCDVEDATLFRKRK